MVKQSQKPMIVVEAALEAVRENPRTSTSVAVLASVGALYMLLSIKKARNSL